MHLIMTIYSLFINFKEIALDFFERVAGEYDTDKLFSMILENIKKVDGIILECLLSLVPLLLVKVY